MPDYSSYMRLVWICSCFDLKIGSTHESALFLNMMDIYMMNPT